MPSLRDTSSAYDMEDALQDAVVESLETEAAGGAPMSKDEISQRAYSLTHSVPRTEQRRGQIRARMKSEAQFETGARYTAAPTEGDDRYETVPEPPKVSVLRSNYEEDAAVARLDVQRFKSELSTEMLDMIERVEAGQSFRTIAKELGLDRETVTRRLRALAPLAQKHLVA